MRSSPALCGGVFYSLVLGGALHAQTVKVQDGGTREIHRDTTTINPGIIAGNDRPMVTTREFWYCPQLGLNLLSTLNGPQSGRQVFTVTELSTSEPDTKFFLPPAGYKVVDRRNEFPSQY
ncbi:MAG TPA: hypothetical protein VMB49_03325 [Acidobacteriaceae bacterium]|nr:hypothetical protein [Acidobacteriaceae bacterium]